MLKKIWQWLVLSSSDPSRLGLSLKGVFLVVIAVILQISGLAHLDISGSDLTPIFDSIVSIVTSVLQIVGYAVTAYGALRKAYRSLIGTNAVTIAQKSGAL